MEHACAAINDHHYARRVGNAAEEIFGRDWHGGALLWIAFLSLASDL